MKRTLKRVWYVIGPTVMGVFVIAAFIGVICGIGTAMDTFPRAAEIVGAVFVGIAVLAMLAGVIMERWIDSDYEVKK